MSPWEVGVGWRGNACPGRLCWTPHLWGRVRLGLGKGELCTCLAPGQLVWGGGQWGGRDRATTRRSTAWFCSSRATGLHLVFHSTLH